jgi:hypothetical protein
MENVKEYKEKVIFILILLHYCLKAYLILTYYKRKTIDKLKISNPLNLLF